MYFNKLYFEATALLYTLTVIMVLIVIAGGACVCNAVDERKGTQPASFA